MTYRSECKCACHKNPAIIHVAPCCQPDPKPNDELAKKLHKVVLVCNRALGEDEYSDSHWDYLPENPQFDYTSRFEYRAMANAVMLHNTDVLVALKMLDVVVTWLKKRGVITNETNHSPEELEMLLKAYIIC